MSDSLGHRLVHRLSWLVLVLGTGFSVWLNAQHAQHVHDSIGFHTAMPISALLLGLYAELIFLSGYAWPVRWLAGLITGAFFIASMSGSYLDILEVMRFKAPHAEPWLHVVAAAAPDAIMIVATSVLLAHRWHQQRHAQSTSDARESRLRRISGKLLDRVEARVDQPVHAPRHDPVHEPVHEPVYEPARVHERERATDRALAEARELIASSGKRSDPNQVAAVLQGLDDGQSIAALSRDLSMAQRTIREIRDLRRPHLVESRAI